MIMLQRVLLSCAVIAAWPASSFAQTGFADLIDHIHLAAPDQPKAVEWYHAHFGAEPTPEGPDRAMLGTTRLIFQKSEMPKPSAGSILGAIGFSVPDLDGAIKKLQADGVKMVMPPMVMQGIRSAQVVDPWGTMIDVVQDPKKLGLHHITLATPDPAATLAWFAGTFGGKVAKYENKADGINYGGVWLFANQGKRRAQRRSFHRSHRVPTGQRRQLRGGVEGEERQSDHRAAGLSCYRAGPPCGWRSSRGPAGSESNWCSGTT